MTILGSRLEDTTVFTLVYEPVKIPLLSYSETTSHGTGPLQASDPLHVEFKEDFGCAYSGY